MKKCSSCGTDLQDEYKVCPNCGSPVEDTQSQVQSQSNVEANIVNEQPFQQNVNQVEQKGNFGWAVLGFFIPIVGWILYFVWKNQKPGDAKMAGIGGIVGFIINLIILSTGNGI